MFTVNSSSETLPLLDARSESTDSASKMRLKSENIKGASGED